MPSIYDVILFAGMVLMAWLFAKNEKLIFGLPDWEGHYGPTGKKRHKRRYVKKARTATFLIPPVKKPRRKRRTKLEMLQARAAERGIRGNKEADTFLKPIPSDPPAVKRKRGRPRKADSIPAPAPTESAIPAVN